MTNQGILQKSSSIATMSSTNTNFSSILGGVVFSRIRCYLNPEQIGKKYFGKPKVQLVFSYNKRQRETTKSEIILSKEKNKKRANWGENISFEILSNAPSEFYISIYNTSVSGPNGRLGEATGDFRNIQLFKLEENRITLPFLKQGEEKIGEISFHAHLLSSDPPRSIMEKIGDPSIRTKKVGMLLINKVKFTNLAGRRGTLEIKLKEESHSTEGYWNTTTKEWKYPIALAIYANPDLELVIQCRYTEHERASTKIGLGEHDRIWKNLMNGNYKTAEYSLQGQGQDAARIEFTLSCHKIVTSKALFSPEEDKPESLNSEPINNIIIKSKTTINNNIHTDLNDCNNNNIPEQNYPISAQKIRYNDFPNFIASPPLSPRLHPLPQIPQAPQLSQVPQLPATPLSSNTVESTNVNNIHSPIYQNVTTFRQNIPRSQTDNSQFRNINMVVSPVNPVNSVNPIPVPPRHPRRNATIEEEADTPPSPDRIIDVIDATQYENVTPGSLKSNPSYPPNIPPRPNIPDINPQNRQYRASPPPPPYHKQTNNNNLISSLKIICQRYVIANPLRLGNLRGREEMNPYQNKLYKGHHILSGLNVVIKEFSSQVSWDFETTYLKELKSRHIVKWVDKDSDPSTGVFYSITEYYGRALQLEACKFNLGKIKQVFKNICTAVSWIHSKDVVHLDLNPTNIICKEGKENHKIRICDFETSRQYGETMNVFLPAPDAQPVQYSNQVFSSCTQFTVGYTCPELLMCYDNKINNNQTMEVPVHFSQDIFSVGCILYFLYNNKALYSTTDELEEYVTMEKGFEDKIREGIEDERIASLILKCISKKSNERPTIEEILGDRYFNVSVGRSYSKNSKNSHDNVRSESLDGSDDDDDDDDDDRSLR